jgi:uncharacterized membrane protein
MNGYNLTFLIGLCLLFLLTGLVYRHFFPSSGKISPTQDMAIDAIFIALILIMSFVPNMGYITVAPGISLTLVHIPVLIGACLRGVKKGTLYGLVFGISSWLEALIIGSGFNLFFIYPWTAIPSRVVFGFLAGLLYDLVRKFPKVYAKSIYLALVSLALTWIHTGLVFFNLWIFYHGEIEALFASSNPVASGVSWTFLGVILLGAAGESILAFILVPSVSLALRKALPHLWARG